MTREKWAKMSDKEKRIKIAELCGWKLEKWKGKPSLADEPTEKQFRLGNKLVRESHLPDYLHDLNAIREAIIAQDNIGFNRKFVSMLELVCHGSIGTAERRDSFSGRFIAYNASAVQRAEAFCLAKEQLCTSHISSNMMPMNKIRLSKSQGRVRQD